MGSDLDRQGGQKMWVMLYNEGCQPMIGSLTAVCQLCRTREENTLHIMAKYANEVWSTIISRNHFLPPLSDVHHIRYWWDMISEAGTTSREQHMWTIIHTAWNRRKERYRQVFDNKLSTTTTTVGQHYPARYSRLQLGTFHSILIVGLSDGHNWKFLPFMYM